MLEFTFKEKPDNKLAYKLVEEWQERLEAFIAALPQEVAKDVHLDIMKMAPSDMPKYPDMLKVVQFPDQQGWKVVGVLPPGWNYSQRLRTSDVQRTVLYVLPKLRAGKVVSEAAVVLERNNPWTMDTLPYEPRKDEASLRARRIDESLVKKVEEERKADRARIVSELRSLGVPIRATGKVLLERRVSRDIAFEVLRREKGIGMPGKAHWRPAVRAIYTQHFKKAMEELGVWMVDPENEQWKERRNLPPETASVIKRVQEFQDRIVPGGA